MLDRRIDVHFRRFPKIMYNEERVALLKTPLLQVHNIILLYMRRDAKRIVRIFVRSCILYIYVCYIVYIGAPDSRCRAIIIYFVFRFFFVFGRGGRNTNIIRASCSTVISYIPRDFSTAKHGRARAKR